MAITIGELRGILTLQDRFSKPINSAAGQLGKFSKSVGAVTKLAAGAAGAIAATTGAVVALGVRGSKVEGIKSSFEALSQATRDSADEMLGSMRTATQGLVSDFELMSAANKAMLLGLPVTAESMGTMAKAATILGRAMNQDATKSLDDLTTALGRGSPLILDNLGLTVKVGEANEAYARQLGKSTSELTEGEKKLAFYNAAMDAAKVRLGELGDLQLSFGLRVEQAKTMVANFVDSLGLAVATSPVVAAGMDGIMAAMQGAFGGDQQQTVQKLMGHINDFAIGLTYVGQVATTAASVFVTVWSAIKTTILGVITVLSAQATAVVSFVSGVAELGTKIPVVGEKVRGFAEGADALADAMKDVTVGMAAQTAEAAKGVAGNSDLHRSIDAVSGTLINVRERMEAAKDAQVDLTKAVKQGGDAADEVVPRTKEATAKITEAWQKLSEEIALSGKVGVDRRLTELQFGFERELDALSNLKDITDVEYEELVALVAEKYRRMTEAARLGSDEILEKTRSLHEEIALLTATGTEQELLQIEQKRDAEIAALAHLQEEYPKRYAELVALTNERYNLMSQAAQGHYQTVEQLAEAGGFKTREELEKTARVAEERYRQMAASGKYSAETLRRAQEAAEEAKRNAVGETGEFTLGMYAELTSGVLGILEAFGVRSKAAAAAGAVIQGIAAIQKAWNSAPFPLNLPGVAVVTAATLANVSRIRSSKPGYETGTPGTHFLDYGRGADVMLHGQEAVVTKAQGASLAAMVMDAVGGGGQEIIIRNIINLDGRKVAENTVRHMPGVLATAGVR